jgi:hypothetical protein
MRILKSLGVGVLAAIVAAAGWVVLRLVALVFTETSVLVAALVGFLTGFVWMLRRASRAARTSR